MANSIKLKNNNYLDSTGIVHNRELLSTILNKFNLNVYDNKTSGTITGGGTLSGLNVTIQQNQDGSLAKIYGQIDISTNGKTGNVIISSNLRPTSEIVVKGIVYRSITNSSYVRNNCILNLTISTNGNISIPYVYAVNANDACRISIFESLIFIKDL